MLHSKRLQILSFAVVFGQGCNATSFTAPDPTSNKSIAADQGAVIPGPPAANPTSTPTPSQTVAAAPSPTPTQTVVVTAPSPTPTPTHTVAAAPSPTPTPSPTAVAAAPSPTPTSTAAADPSETVCNPFGGNTGPTFNSGIQAQLTYLTPNSNTVTRGGLSTLSFDPSVNKEVIVSPNQLMLGQLNVPTRNFSQGFATQDSGDLLRSPSGEALIEFFSLRAHSNLRLAPTDAEGDYEIAILSDDGATMDLSPSGMEELYKPWISNDGDHPNELGCAKIALPMRQGNLYPFKMNYYQGPRYRIALMMLWRKKTSSTTAEPECGIQRDDSYYFTQTSTSLSSPTSKYNALISRGWKPIPAANFVLPDQQTNPCLTK